MEEVKLGALNRNGRDRQGWNSKYLLGWAVVSWGDTGVSRPLYVCVFAMPPRSLVINPPEGSRGPQPA